MDQMFPDSSAARDYHAYLLRLWREDADAPWRCSLQAADGTQRLGFADMAQLVAYLLRLADGDARGARDPPTSRPPA